jgi:hypothetical protein
MMWPTKNTPVDAYEVPVSFLPFVAASKPVGFMTCRPTYYALLFFAGLSSLARPFAEIQRVTPGTGSDYLVYACCLMAAVLMAQVAELCTRPMRRDFDVIRAIRSDRVPRMLNASIALAVVFANQMVHGFAWGGQLMAVCAIGAGTIIGDILYHAYGKKNLRAMDGPTPTRRARRRRANRPRTA